MTDINYQIGHQFYDNDGNLSSYSLSNTALKIGSTYGTGYEYQWVGLTWYYPTIPVGAIITSAYISFYVTGITGSPPGSMRIYFDDSDANYHVADYADISGRDRTTAYVDYAIPAGSSGWVNTSNLSTIIQELVNSYDYSAGDKMMTAILVAAVPGANHYASVISYDSNPSFSPKLYITYALPSGGQVRFIGMAM